MDLPPSPRPWDHDDAVLISVLQREDGHAIVAVKLPESPRAAQAAGRRAAIPAAAFEEGLQVLAQAGAEVLHVYRSFGAAAVRIDPARGPELRKHPRVDYLEPRQWYQASGTPADAAAIREMIAVQSRQSIPWGISMVRADAWAVSTGSNVKVMVIDNGTNPHEDLPAIPNANCGGYYGGCDDGPFYHGTHVAGIALARNNSIGVVGVAHGVAADHVYSWGACNSTLPYGCPNSEVAAGIDAAKFAGARVINMSLGGTQFDQGIANAVASAWATGSIVLVAAAGNLPSTQTGGVLFYPAALTNVIGVSGIRQDKSFASTSPCPDSYGGSWKSNHGSHVDLAAPFWALSTVGSSSYEDENDGWCGTSMATPHVSGAATLVWSQNPTWTNQQVVDRLLATSEDRGSSGRDDYFGYGIVDAADALGVVPPTPPSVSIDGPTQIQPGATCTWQALASGGAPPYAYSWTNNGALAGTGEYYTGSKDPGNTNSYFTLRVTVTDAASASNYHEITVYENSSAMICPI